MFERVKGKVIIIIIINITIIINTIIITNRRPRKITRAITQ